MTVISSLIEGLFQKLIDFVQWLFNQVFGSWNFGVLFSWLPSDIIAAVNYLIIFLFGLVVLKWIKDLLPI